MHRQAELLKTKFGSAVTQTSQENEVVCIPGLRGRDPKEISVMNLANIINARMSEILEHIYFEIKNSGLREKINWWNSSNRWRFTVKTFEPTN